MPKERSNPNSGGFLAGADLAAFEDLMLKVCDETLEILGGPIKTSTYTWLKVNYSIQREEIPEAFEEFVKALQSMYGVGATVILIGLATTLCKQFSLKAGFDYQEVDLDRLMKIYHECQRKYSEKGGLL